MYGVCAGFFCNVENQIASQIGFPRRRRTQTVGFLGLQDVQRSPVCIRIDCYGRDTALSACALDSQRNLSSVCDQNFFEHSSEQSAATAKKDSRPFPRCCVSASVLGAKTPRAADALPGARHRLAPQDFARQDGEAHHLRSAALNAKSEIP